MNTNTHHHTSVHQHIERLLQHRISIFLVLFIMLIGISSFDNRVRSVLQEAYMQGWSWMVSHMTHEHPPHTHAALNTVRVHTVSGGAGS